jgi:hypothetical protein
MRAKILSFPSVETRPILTDNEIVCEGYQAITNPDNDHLYTVASDKYHVTRHEDLLITVEEAIAENPEFGHFKRSISFTNDGARMRAKYRFPDVEFPLDHSDVINPTVEVYNSYDLSWSRRVLFGAFRLVCSNGLVIGKTFMNYRRKHSYLDQDNREIKSLLMSGMELFSEQTELWKSWVDKVTTPEQYERVMTGLDFSNRQMEEVEREVEVSSNIILEDVKRRSLSYWVFFNILSQYITHRVKSENRRVSLENHMRKYF